MMADSNWASGLQVSRWAKQLYYETAKEIYFEKFMGCLLYTSPSPRD